MTQRNLKSFKLDKGLLSFNYKISYMRITNKQLVEEMNKIFKTLNDRIKALETEVKQLKEKNSTEIANTAEALDSKPGVFMSKISNSVFQLSIRHDQANMNKQILEVIGENLLLICLQNQIRSIKFDLNS